MTSPLGKRAEEKAYRLLARRAHSERELRTKLAGSGFSETVIQQVIDRCRELGYLDDAAYARQRARDLVVNRLAGDRRIAFDLRDRGIPEELCREAIAEARGELSQGEALDRLLGRQAGEEGAGMDAREKARWIRRLLGRGFPAGLIYEKLKGGQEEGFHDDDGE
jgi:regulatory protein